MNANGCSAQANEEFVGLYYKSGSGWLWYSIETLDEGVDKKSNIIAYPCADGGALVQYNSTDCAYWNFPSDGG